MRQIPPTRADEGNTGSEGHHRQPSPPETTELDPLIPAASVQNYQTESSSLRERRSGKTPPPHNYHMHRSQHFDGDDTAAVATTRASRQLFYRDRIPSTPTESRDYIRTAAPLNLPVNASSDSTDSSVDPFTSTSLKSGLSGTRASDRASLDVRGTGSIGGIQPSTIPPPQQLHAEYRDRLYKNRLATNRGDTVVVGGPHGRFRGNGGTLIEVSEEVYAVRKAALTVLDPLTYCWLVLTIGFSISVAFGTAKSTGVMQSIPYWLIFLPAWLSHGGIVLMHISSARALSKFISEANENRQRPDSTDHLDRVEYLPLLQRSLKFGLKTGVLCFVVFVFEVLLFIRLSNPGAITLAETYVPFWILTIGFIANGIVCKSQHFLHVLVWVLVFTAMLLSVLKIDFDYQMVRISHIVIIIVALLAITSGSLIYIVYGHQIGYFKLTDPQLTAGVFYSLSAFLSILLVAIMADVIELPELIQVDMRLVVIILSPIVVALVGLGAWAVTRDEFDRLLRNGGQSAVIPMKLRLESDGWTSVEGRGVSNIPMFGDVRFEPLDAASAERLSLELCGACCFCYPTEEDDDLPHHLQGRNSYQSPTPSSTMAVSARWGGGESIV